MDRKWNNLSGWFSYWPSDHLSGVVTLIIVIVHFNDEI